MSAAANWTKPSTQILSDAGFITAVAKRTNTAVSLIDARVPSSVADGAIAAAERKAGAAHAIIRDQGAVFGAALHDELHALAGGEAPASVMALAHLAVEAMIDHRVVALVARGAVGRWAAKHESIEARGTPLDEVALDKDAEVLERLEQHVTSGHRVAAGLAIAARDLLRAARESAKESKRERPAQNGKQSLLTSLGITPTQGQNAPTEHDPGQTRPTEQGGSAETQVDASKVGHE